MVLYLIFNGLNIYFNGSQNKFMIPVYGVDETITITEKDDFFEISIINCKKMVFYEKELNLIISHKEHGQTWTTF